MSCSVEVAGKYDLAQGTFTVHPEKHKQVVKGIGFEIQSDSIGSGNHGMPEEPISVPHDLVPSERERFAKEMLKGFRYCRLAGGLYWRGLDPENKFLQPRWPEQLQELKQLLDRAGVEGLSFEYWSPAPFWKGNQAYFAAADEEPGYNTLRCFAPDFDKDPVYKGNTNRFLADFGQAVVADISTLEAAGLKVLMWGLQNEPYHSNTIYGSCKYDPPVNYVKAYCAVAEAIREKYPDILLCADTGDGFPHIIGPHMNNPSVAKFVDAYVVHIIDSSSEKPLQVHEMIKAQLPARQWFQNEYEYLRGGATPDRCLNTVQHIMNSFQLAGNPTWFWLHALKPLNNAEASGYSLGFWKSPFEPVESKSNGKICRWPKGPVFSELPEAFSRMEMVGVNSCDLQKPAIGYEFSVNQPVTVYLLAEDCEGATMNSEWERTGLGTEWKGGKDIVFKRKFPAGYVRIPGNSIKKDDRYTAPHLVFTEPSTADTLKVEIGINTPLQIRSESLAFERKTAEVKPGHWIFNNCNWNAVGSFVRRMPWDSLVLDVEEAEYDPHGRILAFKKPDGKMTVVVSNQSLQERLSSIETGSEKTEWKGFRYNPDDSGENAMGVSVGKQSDTSLKVTLPPLSWEFWEQQ